MSANTLFQRTNSPLRATAFGLVLSSAMLSGCATAGASNPYSLPPDQLASISQICHSTIGGTDKDPHYGVCVDSLSSKISEQRRNAKLAQADATCREAGVQPGAALALCVLDHTSANKVPTSSRQGDTAADILQREKIACAKIGLNPAGGSFADCVADMQDGFDKVDAPMTN